MREAPIDGRSQNKVKSKKLNKQKRAAIFDRLAQAIPEPTTELNYQTPFELLVAVVLSAQATDKGVNKATAELFPIANTPTAILTMGESGLKEHIKTIGLFNNKAKNILAMCQILLEQHDGQVPDSRSDLEALPGVGRKTANVVLNTAFGHSTIAVDTHIFRVCNRTRLAQGKNVVQVENGLEKWVPDAHKKDAHHLLILHGRYTCIARKPRCGSCVIEDLCEYRDKILD